MKYNNALSGSVHEVDLSDMMDIVGHLDDKEEYIGVSNHLIRGKHPDFGNVVIFLAPFGRSIIYSDEWIGLYAPPATRILPSQP